MKIYQYIGWIFRLIGIDAGLSALYESYQSLIHAFVDTKGSIDQIGVPLWHYRSITYTYFVPSPYNQVLDIFYLFFNLILGLLFLYIVYRSLTPLPTFKEIDVLNREHPNRVRIENIYLFGSLICLLLFFIIHLTGTP